MKKNAIVRILVKIPRPSRIPSTIEMKESSEITISDASFATSVPCIPIAIPASAIFKANASLTPSPVIATTFF